MSEVKVNKISPRSGTDVTLGDSGDTFTVPSGATITNSGTATGFGDDNTPAFSAYTSAATTTISTATETKITLDTEEFDSDGAFDSTTNYRFTVPAGEGGKYLFSASITYLSLTNVTNMQAVLKKNGSAKGEVVCTYSPAINSNMECLNGVWIIDLAATDYIELYGYINGSGTIQYNGNATSLKTWLSGFKLGV